MRAKVIEVIHKAAVALSEQRPEPVATEPKNAAIEAACSEVGIEVREFEAAIAADRDLAELEREALSGAVVETPDPGPHAAVSRESPSGKPGDVTRGHGART